MHMKKSGSKFTVLVHQNVSVRIHCRKKNPNLKQGFFSPSLHIHNIYSSNVCLVFFFFLSLTVCGDGKGETEHLLNKDCVLDILQGHLNLGIADDLVQTEIDESTCSHFSESSTMNW